MEEKKLLHFVKYILLCTFCFFVVCMPGFCKDVTDYTKIDNIVDAYNDMQKKVNNDKNFYVFISFSMPEIMIKNYFIEAKSLKQKKDINIVFVLRGFYKNSFKETLIKISSLLSDFDDKNVNIVIDPTFFRKYIINQVPAILKNCKNDFYKITGSVSITYALKQFSGGNCE